MEYSSEGWLEGDRVPVLLGEGAWGALDVSMRESSVCPLRPAAASGAVLKCLVLALGPRISKWECVLVWVTRILFWTHSSFCSEEECDESKERDSWDGRGAAVGAGRPSTCVTASDTWAASVSGDVGQALEWSRRPPLLSLGLSL